MSKKIDPTDIVGQKYGKLTVVEYMDSGRPHKYRCLCECGNETIAERYHLLSGHTTSCGCAKRDLAKGADLVGQRFGSLVVEEYLGVIRISKGTEPVSCLKCRCDCGNETIVKRSSLIDGHTKSCGDCFKPEIVPCEDYYRYICRDGKEFLFDAYDLELAKSLTWHIGEGGYPVGFKDGQNVNFCRLALKPRRDQIIDHINGNTADERRANLRIANPMKNIWNSIINSRNSTGFKGIYPDNHGPGYVARICEHGNKHYLGYFSTKEEAARAYDEAARFYFGEFACVNFPLPGEQCCRRNLEETQVAI